MRALALGMWLSLVVFGCGTSGTKTDSGGSDAGGGDTTTAQGATTVAGTLTLPGTASGKAWGVQIVTGPGATPVGQASGLTTGSTTLPYSIANVPAGTYFMVAFVDVDGMGTTGSTPGDYRGWYGHNGDGNPPASPNVVVPASGTVTFDWSLVVAL